jgi:hypothetical protein
MASDKALLKQIMSKLESMETEISTLKLERTKKNEKTKKSVEKTKKSIEKTKKSAEKTKKSKTPKEKSIDDVDKKSELKAFSRNELLEYAKQNGLKRSGTKEQLIKIIWDNMWEYYYSHDSDSECSDNGCSSDYSGSSDESDD